MTSTSTHPIGTVTAFSLFLRTKAIISAEMRQCPFTGDAADLCCFIFAPLASKQTFRVKDIGRSSAVTETAATRSKSVIFL